MMKKPRGIGASDVAAICGLDKYRSPLDVYLEKLGLVEKPPPTEPMRWGQLLEPYILDEYQEKTGLKVKPHNQNILLEHPDHPWVIGKPDGYVIDPGMGEPPIAGIDAKNVGGRQANTWGEPRTDEIPEKYILQALWYQFITSIKRWDFAVLIGGNEFRHYSVMLNEDLLRIVFERCSEFWHQYLVKEDPPPMDAGKRVSEWLYARYPLNRGPIVRALPPHEDIAANYRDIRKQIDSAEAKEKELKNKLKEIIGDNAGIKSDWFEITWRAVNQKGAVDWESVARQAIDELITRGIIDKESAENLIARQTIAQKPYRRFVSRFKDSE